MVDGTVDGTVDGRGDSRNQIPVDKVVLGKRIEFYRDKISAERPN